MMKLTLYPFELPFKHPFAISRATKSTQPTMVVKVEHEGDFGLGEAAANTYYDLTVADLQADLENIQRSLEGHPLHS